MTEEDSQIIKSMVNYGGHFARQLAVAAAYADTHNLGRIKAAFPELWSRYQEVVKIVKEREENREKCYSIDGENFAFDTVEDTAEEVWHATLTHKVGDVITIWEADKIPCKASDFTPRMAECLNVSAYEEFREHADSWNFTEDQKSTLQYTVDVAVDAWAEGNGVQPKFFRVANVTQVRVRFIDEEGGCEVVTDNEQTQP